MSTTYLHSTATTTKPTQPAFARTRRTLIRLQARRDEWLRRELDAGQTVRAHRHEIGGDFSILS